MNYFCVVLLAVAFLVVECLAGGTRLIYSLPAYSFLAAAAVFSVFTLRGKRVPARPVCLISSALFFGYIIYRCLQSPVEYLARQDLFMVLGCLAIYLLVALQIVKPKYRTLLFGVLLFIAVGQTAVGLVQFSRGNEFMLFGYGRYPCGVRASGQYVSPNHLAGYLEVVAIMGMALVFWGTWKPWVKILAGYASLCAFVGIVITASRGGYLSTGFCILCFVVLSATAVKIAFPESFARVVIAAVILLVVVGATVPVLVTSDFLRNRAGELLAPNMRTLLWAAAWKQTKLDPVFGTGSGTYLYYGRKFRDPSVQRDPIRVHNDYLDLLAEYGAIGAAGFLFFLSSHLWAGFRTFRWLVSKRLQFALDWRSSSLALNIGCLCAVAAYLVHSVVDFNLHIPANAMLMAFVFGVLANPGIETFQAGAGSIGVSRLFQCLLPVLGAVILYFGVQKLPGEYYAEKARVALRDRQFTVSIAAAKTGIEKEKNNPDLYYYLGEARRNLGDRSPAPELKKIFYGLASDAFKQGVQLFPQDARLLLIEGWTLDALGQFDEAGYYFQQAMKWDPNWDQVHASYMGHLEYLRNAGKILRVDQPSQN